MLIPSLDEQPYNTITSPQQQASVDTGDSAPRDDSPNPLRNLIASVMRGNASVQGNSKAKKIAEGQAETAAKAKLTFNHDGTIDIKNGPADMLMKLNSGQQDVQDAVTAPQLAVTSKLQSSGGGAPQEDGNPLEPSYKLIDANVGHRVPRPWDTDIADKLKTPAGIRDLTKEIGGTQHDAEKAIKALASGRVTPEYMRDRVAAFRTQKAAAMFKSIEPLNNEAQDIAAKNATAQKEAATEKEKTTKEFFTNLTHTVKGIDYSLIPQEDWVSSTEQELGQKVPENVKVGIERKARQDIGKALDKFTEKDEDLAIYDSFDKAKGSFDRPLTPQQESKFKTRWQAAQDAKAEKRRAETRADERLAKTLSGKPDKPVKLPRWQAENLPVDSLLSTLGDPDVDQRSANEAVQTRIGKLTAQRQDIGVRMHQNSMEHAQILKRIQDLQDELKTNPATPNAQTALNQLDARRRHLEVENSAFNQRLGPIISEMDKINGQLGGATQPAGAKILKTATNPQTGEKIGFDGTKWIPLKK